MYHWVIGLGVVLGLAEIFAGGMAVGIAGAGISSEVAGFLGRIVGTCAVFYGFFLCRMLGAGDIKLMAVCVGILGVWRGVLMIFCGMVLALVGACLKGKVWKYGILQMKNQELRLAPYLFAGYCLTVWVEIC